MFIISFKCVNENKTFAAFEIYIYIYIYIYTTCIICVSYGEKEE